MNTNQPTDDPLGEASLYHFDDSAGEGTPALISTRLPLPRRGGKVRDVYDLGGCDKQEPRRWVDKAPDQPWAGDTINFGTIPCYPKIDVWQDFRRDQRRIRCSPGIHASGQDLGIDTVAAQQGNGALA